MQRGLSIRHSECALDAGDPPSAITEAMSPIADEPLAKHGRSKVRFDERVAGTLPEIPGPQNSDRPHTEVSQACQE